MLHTPLLDLTQYEPEDIVNFITQYNSDMLKVDNAFGSVQKIQMTGFNRDNAPYIGMSNFNPDKPFRLFMFDIVGLNNKLCCLPFGFWRSSDNANYTFPEKPIVLRARSSSTGEIMADDEIIINIHFNKVNDALWIEQINGSYGIWRRNYYSYSVSGSNVVKNLTRTETQDITTIKFNYILLQ